MLFILPIYIIYTVYQLFILTRYLYIERVFLFPFTTKCKSWSTTIALRKTVEKLQRQFNTPTNTPMHQSVILNQHVDSTHNQHVNASISKRQPTCQLNTSIKTSMHQLTATNASTQHTTKTSTNMPI